MTTAQGDLFSPANTRTVAYACPCGAQHAAEVPAVWPSRPRTLWTICPQTGAHVAVQLEPKARKQ